MTTHLTRGPIGPHKIIRQSHRTWTDKRRAAFLDGLAATCNVKASCEALGMTTTGLYMLRRRDPAFAAQWRAALLTGYDRLEEMALRLATEALMRIEHGEVETGPVDIGTAIRLMTMHDGRAREATARNRVPPIKRATEAETNAAILKQLAALEKRLRAKVKA